MVLWAANIQVIARARALASAGSRPAWRSAICSTIAPDTEQREIAFLIGGNLAEGLARHMCGLLHLGEGDKATS